MQKRKERKQALSLPATPPPQSKQPEQLMLNLVSLFNVKGGLEEKTKAVEDHETSPLDVIKAMIRFAQWTKFDDNDQAARADWHIERLRLYLSLRRTMEAQRPLHN